MRHRSGGGPCRQYELGAPDSTYCTYLTRGVDLAGIYRIKATKTSARLLTELNNLCVLRPDLRVAIGR